MRNTHFGWPITDDGSRSKLFGILTNRDLRFETNVQRPIADIMTREHLITVPVGTTLDAAREILHQHKVEKLLVVDREFRLKGLITVKDIQKAVKYPNASKDSLGRLRCGGRSFREDAMERAEALVAATPRPVVDTATATAGRAGRCADAAKLADVDLIPSTCHRRRPRPDSIKS